MAATVMEISSSGNCDHFTAAVIPESLIHCDGQHKRFWLLYAATEDTRLFLPTVWERPWKPYGEFLSADFLWAFIDLFSLS